MTGKAYAELKNSRSWGVWRLFLLCSVLLSACATPPDNPGNICKIFDEKRHWYKAAKKSEKRWGAPMPLQLAILRVESSFDNNARPKRDWFLFVPLGRPSSAYGYAQAVDGTWKQYQRSTGRRGADRNDFRDAVDFVGWYVNRSSRQLGISKSDAYRQYLAYHEGIGGYKKRSYRNKTSVKNAARRVQRQTSTYSRQLRGCRKKLERGGWFF